MVESTFDPTGLLELVSELLYGVDDAFSVILALVVIFTFFDGLNRKKKNPSALSADEFNLLTLENDPNVEVRKEVAVKSTPKNRAPIKHQSLKVPSTPAAVKPASDLSRELSAEDAREAIILSEVLGKPKALRRR